MRINYECSDEVKAAIAGVGRTEDLIFSPDGKRLAIAGYQNSCVLILTVDPYDAFADIPRIVFSKALTLRSPSFDHPHGLCWLDDETLIVANRNALVPIVRAPQETNDPELVVRPIQLIGSSLADLVHTPGSVAANLLEDDLVEILVCNNYADTVTRHIVDRRQGWAILSSETAFSNRLSLPDGVATSPSGKWSAISNHRDHSVFIHAAGSIGVSDKPACVLRGVAYPHGLRFTGDDRAILVADAGLPVVHVFVSDDGHWSGVRLPATSIKVIEDDLFKLGAVNEEEGGPKGLALSPDGALFCITCEQEPLVFFEVRKTFAELGITNRALDGVKRSQEPTRAILVYALTKSRDDLGGALRRASEADARVRDLESQLGAEREQASSLAAWVYELRRSTSWKVTAPLRALRSRFARRG